LQATAPKARWVRAPIMATLRWAKNLLEWVLLMLVFASLGWFLAHIMTRAPQ